jgi:sialidase-1
MDRRNLPVLLQLLMFFTVLLISCSTKLPYSGKPASEPRVVLRLNAGENNPRNSEGDFIELKDGSLLFIYSHYYGESAHDHATANLASRTSKDRGMTWSSSDKIEVNNEGGLNVMSVSLLRLQTGEIALFYLRKNAADDCIPMMRLSRDEARTWDDALPCITDKEGYFVLNNDRVIQLPNGRLMLAVAQHTVPGGQFTSKGKLCSYYSEDKGQTWHSSTMVPNPDNITFQEPGLVHLKDNNLLMVIRSDAGTQCFSKSLDGGQTWGPVTRSTLIFTGFTGHHHRTNTRYRRSPRRMEP